MLSRAYTLLEVKTVDDDERIITGIATSASTDRMGDVVEPEGAEYTLPIPLLWQHDSKQPIGEVFAAKSTKAGIEISARIAKTDVPGKLKDRLDEAWQSIKMGLVRGLSIGFKPLEESYDKVSGGFRFLRWLWLELSAVTIPANADASISTIRSLDVLPAASGTRAPVRLLAGASAVTRVPTRRESIMKSYADQIADWEKTRAAKSARQASIQQKASDESRGKDESEREEFETLERDLEGIDKEIADLRRMEAREKAAAVEVKGTSTREGVQARTPHIAVTRDLPKGFLFARYAMCVANSRGNPGEAMRLAKEHYPDDPGVFKLIEKVEKSAVAGGATSGSHWLDDMVPYSVMNDFIEYLRPGSIIGKFGTPNPGGGGDYPSLRRVGFNERVSGMSTGFTAGWKGEGLPALPSAAVTFNTALLWNCMSALAVLTKEAVRFSNPSAEEIVRRDLAAAVNGKLDLDFIDPAKAASGTTSPASITYGIVATTPSGTAATNFRHDLAAMLGQFATNNLIPNDLVLIMSGTMAAQISMMVNALGQPDFPGLTMKGGQIQGIPVIVSEYLTSVGSPSTQMIVLAKASEIYLADDGVVTVEASDQASVEMQDTSSQSAISGTGASLVSLWQTGAVGLMANREITWKLRRSTAVQYISPAAYVVPTS